MGVRNPVSPPPPTERPLTGGNVESTEHSKQSPVTGTLHCVCSLCGVCVCTWMGVHAYVCVCLPVYHACLNSSNLFILYWILLGVLDTKPTVSELIVQVGKHVFHKWKEFADHLHVEHSLTDAIHREELGNCESAFRSLCSKWLKEDSNPLTGDRPRTWRTVLDAVRKSREIGAAEDIERSLMLGSSPPPNT